MIKVHDIDNDSDYNNSRYLAIIRLLKLFYSRFASLAFRWSLVIIPGYRFASSADWYLLKPTYILAATCCL